MNESLRILEEKIVYLERHVTEQDKAMLELAEDIARLRRELKALRERAEDRGGGAGGSGASTEMPDERPPHY